MRWRPEPDSGGISAPAAIGTARITFIDPDESHVGAVVGVRGHDGGRRSAGHGWSIFLGRRVHWMTGKLQSIELSTVEQLVPTGSRKLCVIGLKNA